MSFVSVKKRAGTVVHALPFEGFGLPEYFYLQWDVPNDPIQMWFMDGGERHLLTPFDPGYDQVGFVGSMRRLADRMALQSEFWPEALWLVWSDGSPAVLRAADLVSGTVQILGSAQQIFKPIAHPDGRILWWAEVATNAYELWQWSPTTNAQRLQSVTAAAFPFALHRVAEKDYLAYQLGFHTTVVDLETGTTTTAAGDTFGAVLEFADSSRDQHAGTLFGGAYGGGNFRRLEVHYFDGTEFQQRDLSSGTATNGIPFGFEATARFNQARTALMVYPYGSVGSGRGKWFDPAATLDQAPNNDANLATVDHPLFDPNDPNSFPHQVFPAAAEI